MGWFSSFVSDAFDTVNEIVSPVTTLIPNPIRVTGQLVGDTFGSDVESLIEVGSDSVDWAQEHPAEVGAIYVGAEAFAAAESGTAFTATAESGSSAFLAPVSDAVAVPVSQIAPWAPAGSTAAFESALASNATSTALSAGNILAATNTGLNLATSATKLSLLGKSMNASTATANGLTGALAPSPIQTPSGLITTTPQGPVMTGTQPETSGFMGMDTQTLFVIAAGIAAVYYFSKHGK